MKLDSRSQPVSMSAVCDDGNSEPSDTGLLSDLMQLAKARLTMLVLVTTAVGFLLAAKGNVEWLLLINTLCGTALVAAGASVFNQVIERKQDALMPRTSNRPIPTGRIAITHAVVGATLTTVAGVFYLSVFASALAALIALLTCLVYVAVYTPLKTRSSSCTLVGGVSGALPPVIGWTAAGGALDSGALYLFGLLFFWQMPHFLAINWMYRKEYENAGYRMWSNQDNDGKRTAWLTLGFAIMLAVACLLQPASIRSMITMIVSLLLVLPLIYLAAHFLLQRNYAVAKRLFLFTLLYLPLQLGILLIWAA